MKQNDFFKEIPAGFGRGNEASIKPEKKRWIPYREDLGDYDEDYMDEGVLGPIDGTNRS